MFIKVFSVLLFFSAFFTSCTDSGIVSQGDIKDLSSSSTLLSSSTQISSTNISSNSGEILSSAIETPSSSNVFYDLFIPDQASSMYDHFSPGALVYVSAPDSSSWGRCFDTWTSSTSLEWSLNTEASDQQIYFIMPEVPVLLAYSYENCSFPSSSAISISSSTPVSSSIPSCDPATNPWGCPTESSSSSSASGTTTCDPATNPWGCPTDPSSSSSNNGETSIAVDIPQMNTSTIELPPGTYTATLDASCTNGLFSCNGSGAPASASIDGGSTQTDWYFSQNVSSTFNIEVFATCLAVCY